MKKKTCSMCKRKLPTSEFYQDKRQKDGLAVPCKTCKRNYERRPHAKRMGFNRMLKYRYGITIEEYNKLFLDQKGRCAICAKHQSELTRKLDVDHDHKTGKVRGLLCNYCNKIIERHINHPTHFKNPVIVKNLNEYLL